MSPNKTNSIRKNSSETQRKPQHAPFGWDSPSITQPTGESQTLAFAERNKGTSSDIAHLRTTPKKRRTTRIAQDERPKKNNKEKGLHFVLFPGTKTGPKTKTPGRTLPNPSQTHPNLTRRDGRPYGQREKRPSYVEPTTYPINGCQKPPQNNTGTDEKAHVISRGWRPIAGKTNSHHHSVSLDRVTNPRSPHRSCTRLVPPTTPSKRRVRGARAKYRSAGGRGVCGRDRQVSLT